MKFNTLPWDAIRQAIAAELGDDPMVNSTARRAISDIISAERGDEEGLHGISSSDMNHTEQDLFKEFLTNLDAGYAHTSFLAFLVHRRYDLVGQP